MNEILSCKKLAISFYPSTDELLHYKLYKDQVIFVKDVHEMIQKINFYVNNKDEYNKIIQNINFNENKINVLDFL